MFADDPELVTKCNGLTEQIIGAAIEVHRYLGPGCLESVYEACLCRELSLRDLQIGRQVPVSVDYKGVKLACGFRVDVLVENLIVVEIKSVARLEPIFEAQLLTYLRLTKLNLGLLLNFNEIRLKDGIKRVVNG